MFDNISNRAKAVVISLLLVSFLGPMAFLLTKGNYSRPKPIIKHGKEGGLEHIPYVWKEDVARRVLTEGNCSCPNSTKTATSWYTGPKFAPDPEDLREIMARRNREKERLEQRAPPPTPVLFADGKSPLSYPTQGLKVEPMKSITIPGVKLERVMDKEIFDIQINAQLGVLTTLADVPDVRVEGVGSKHLSISSGSLEHLNRQLEFLVYTNTDFNPDTVDNANVRYDNFEETIPIRIQHRAMSQIYDFKEDDITTKVTIVTKTFLRYDMLRQMIDSVRQFYATITIIIADDSEHPEKVQGQNIEHYTMPFAKGWFAGRNLAVSQVTTPYFLWVDDDFIFTSQTRIELLLQVIEHSNLDIVGGMVKRAHQLGGGNRYAQKFRIEDGDADGDCLFWTRGYYHTVEGFPDCKMADMVVNFFLADTTKVRSVGFDPKLTRVGHPELFLDGLGKLRVASCSHVTINHATMKHHGTYAHFRHPGYVSNYKFFFYKYNIKCVFREGP